MSNERAWKQHCSMRDGELALEIQILTGVFEKPDYSNLDELWDLQKRLLGMREKRKEFAFKNGLESLDKKWDSL